MTMQLKSGDYVILNIIMGKKLLARISSVNAEAKRYTATVEANSDKDEPPIEFKLKSVVANLGSSPQAGSVYGIKVEPLRERLDHPFWGAIKIHHPLADDQRKTLKRVMQDTCTKLKALNAPKLALETQIRTVQGAMLGFYKYRPKADNDILCVKLDDDMLDIEYKFAHEFAHGIWYRCFTPKMKMAWVELFHNQVQIGSYSEKDLKTLLDDLQANGDLRAFVKENPDDVPVIKAIFRHIKQTHGVERTHIEMALVLGQDISKYWPTHVELGEKQQVLTAYAKKSPEELWAEAFSLKFIGKKLPSKIASLLENCMQRLVK